MTWEMLKCKDRDFLILIVIRFLCIKLNDKKKNPPNLRYLSFV